MASSALVVGTVVALGSSIASAGTVPVQIQVDFGPANVAPASGYVRDAGPAFSASTGTGWSTVTDKPLDMTNRTRARNAVSDKRLDTFIHASYNKAAVEWNMAVPAGTYTVTVGVGDAKFYDSVHVVNVEGVRVVDKFVPSKSTPFKIVTATVPVTDGFLTLDSVGGTNVKIGFLTAYADVPVSSSPATTSSAPAPVVSSSAPAPVVSPSAPAPVVSSSAPAPVVSSSAPAPVVSSPAPADTSVQTQLAWFYKPPVNSADEPAVLSNFDYYVLSKGDETFLAKVRAAKPQATVLQYFLLSQIIKPASGSVEPRNNAAYTPGDFDNLWTNHNDWFLKDANGNAIVEGGKYYRMDPGNAEWQKFWVDRVLAANTAWDGVFTDNLDLSLCAFDRAGISVPKYPTDALYTDALQGFMKYAYERITVGAGKPVSSNLVNGCSGRDNREKYFAYLSGGMDEAWAVDWSSGYVSASTWTSDLASVDRFAGQLGRQMILVSQGSSTDTVRQQFAFASYLLVSAPNVVYRYSNAAQTDAYKVPWLFGDYQAKLGAPLGARKTLADGTVRRDFANGYVIVNPTTHESWIVAG